MRAPATRRGHVGRPRSGSPPKRNGWSTCTAPTIAPSCRRPSRRLGCATAIPKSAHSPTATIAWRAAWPRWSCCRLAGRRCWCAACRKTAARGWRRCGWRTPATLAAQRVASQRHDAFALARLDAGSQEIKMVPKAGLEPARLAPLPPQDSVSTKFHHFGASSRACGHARCIRPAGSYGPAGLGEPKSGSSPTSASPLPSAEAGATAPSTTGTS